jgi:hypothetical protein
MDVEVECVLVEIASLLRNVEVFAFRISLLTLLLGAWLIIDVDCLGFHRDESISLEG